MASQRVCACGAAFTPNGRQKRCNACRFGSQHTRLGKANAVTRYCGRCGRVFVPANPRDMYCGAGCLGRRRAGTPTEKPCQHCGTVFTPTTNQKYCASCLVAGVRTRRIEFSELPCLICGTLFVPKRRGSVVCSANCRQRRWYQASRRR